MVQLLDSVDSIGDLAPRLERRPFRLGFGPGLAWRLGCVAVDVAMLALTGVATFVGAGAAGIVGVSEGWTIAYCALVFSLLAARGLYGSSFGLRTADDLRRVAGATGLAAISLLALAAVVGGSASDVDQTLRLWLFATVYVGAGRVALNWSHRRARIAGEGLRPTLIVGAGRVGRLAAARLLDKPEVGLKPIGFLDKDPLADDGSGVALPVLGASWDLEEVVREHDVEQVIITFSTAPNDVLLRLVRRCEELGVAVAVVPRLYEQTTTRLSVDHIGGLPLVSASATNPRGLHFALKYALDRLVSLVLVVALAPLLIAIAIATLLLGRRTDLLPPAPRRP